MSEHPSTEAPPTRGGPTASELLAALHEQRACWQRGEPLPVEALLQRYPGLEADADALLDLLVNEVLCREQRGERPEPDEYRRRFPRLASRLEARIPTQREADPAAAGDSGSEGPLTRADLSSGTAPEDHATRLGGEVSPEAPGPWPAVPGYEILGELGRGGMGVVYKARQAKLNRLVALKMILAGAHAGSQELTRFKLEAQAIARLRHPNIVQVFEVGEHEGQPYFSLEFVEGGSLAGKLGGSPLPPREAAPLLRALAAALHDAHQKGVVHRDLKPHNVLLTEDRTPKVTDFGLAKRLDEDSGQTRDGAVMGTPSYMAPEQARGRTREIGPAADVYALGAILYELLTGRPPFRGATVIDTLDQVCSQEPVAPSRLVPRCPRDLETICLKCLEKEPARRYASARELADDLDRFLKGEPITARPVTAWERARKWARRRPAVAALAATTVLTAVVGFLLVTWKWREAVAQRESAVRAALAEAEAQRVAERHRQEAAQARARVEEARRADYCSTIRFADQWLARDAGKAEDILNLAPPDLRRWEWPYLKRRCHPERVSFRADPAGVNCLALSADGRRLAAGGGEMFASKGEPVRVWDTATYQDPTVLAGHTAAVTAVAFLPGGERLVSASARVDFKQVVLGGNMHAAGEVILWDVRTRKRLHTFPGYGSVALGPDARLLASAGLDGTLKVWDVETGSEQLALPGPRGLIGSVCFSPDGRALASAGTWADVRRGTLGSEIKVWSLAGKKVLFTIAQDGVEINHLAFSPDGKRLAAAGSDRKVHVWDAATGAPVHTLRGHDGSILTLAFGPGGSGGTPPLLASAGADRTVRVWDAAGGDERFTLRGHAAKVKCLAFDPSHTGPGWRLVSADADGVVKVWDDEAGPGHVALRGHTHTVLHIAFGPGGRLASAGADGTVRVWEAGTGKALRTIRCRAERLAFSPDGKRLASAGGDSSHPDQPGTLKVWDVETGRVVLDLRGHTLYVVCACFSPDGRYLVSASGNPLRVPFQGGEVKVWDAASGKELHTFDPHAGMVYGMCFSPDGRHLALACTDKTVRVCEAPAGREVGRLRGHRGWAQSVAYSPDGRRLASGDSEGVVLVWDVATGQSLRTLRPHAGAVFGLAYHPDGTRLAAASYDPLNARGDVRLWEPDSRREVLTLPGQLAVAFSPDGRLLAAPAEGGLAEARAVLVWDGKPVPEVFTLRGRVRALSVAYSPDGTRLASAHADGTARVWDAASAQERLALRGHAGEVLSVAFSRDGQRLATAGADQKVKVWDAETGRELLTLSGHGQPVWGVDFSPDGRHLATAGGDQTVRVWDAATGQEEHRLEGHKALVFAVAYSPDGTRLASAGRDRTVIVWDPADGRRVQSLPPCTQSVLGLAYSRDGKYLAAGVGRGGNAVVVWDTEGWKERHLLRGHADAVFGVAFSPDGHRLASCGLDRAVRIWDLGTGRSRTLVGHTDLVRKVAFSPDGQRVVSAGADGSVRVWDVGSGE
jgi:WD40 repeat protein/tRNA A-37 threonylcarbamoyl transferase component Bud32